MTERERRIYELRDTEFREEGDKLHFIGKAAVFNVLSEELWGFKEKIAPGAFAKTITEADVRFLQNHDSNLVLARSKAGQGTLGLAEDNEGLAVEADMAPTSYARDLSIVMQRGDVDQMSFAFRVIREEWDESDPDNVIRTIKEVKLYDVSVVTFPAYPQTTAEVRQHVAQLRGTESESELERVLKDLSIRDLSLIAPTAEELARAREVVRQLEGLLERAEPAPSGIALDVAKRRLELAKYQIHAA